MLFQTGGGCRASNYISLLRKALEKAGYGYVPVISFSFAGIEKHPGFRLTLPMIYHMLYAVLYADLLMTLVNQVRPYEERAGESEELAEAWTNRLADELAAAKGLQGRRARQNIAAMLMDFARIPRRQEKRVKVGVVGEIYVKYSPLGNNDLEAFCSARARKWWCRVFWISACTRSTPFPAPAGWTCAGCCRTSTALPTVICAASRRCSST